MTPPFFCPDAQAFLRLLHTPDGLVAVRSLNPQEEWHFRRDNLKDALPLLERHSGRRALYACLNPVRADMGAGYAEDKDITSLRWFPIDADPVRPPGTASTETEKAAAVAVLDDLLDALRVHLPGLDNALIRGDSGNGSHALLLLPGYPPHGAEGGRSEEWHRLKRIHTALCKKFSTSAVKLDTSVLNPSRIWRLYGTLNVKGENTPERPHRLARLLSVPDDLRPLDILAYETALTEAFATPSACSHPLSGTGRVAEERGREGSPGLPDLPPWWTELVTPGDRNNAAYQRARWLLNTTEGGYPVKEAWEELRAWNKVVCRPRLDEEELRKTFDSARKAGDNPDFATPPAREPEAWPPTVPLPAHERPPFPLIALPDALRGYIKSVAHTLQVPADLPALLGLAAVAAAGARVCRVQIGTTHAEPLNLYVAAVMEPGSRKSAAMEALSFPLQEAEREMVRDAAPALATAREQRAVQEKHQTVLRDQAAKAKAATERARLMQELGELAASLEDVPAAPRLLADDVTQEQLATLMAEQGGCMSLFSAEGGIFGILAGRYNAGGTNLDLFLKSHNGDPFRVDRKGRPAEHIPYPCLTMGLTVQPDVLASLADTPSFRGRGLLGRFLYTLPDSLVGTRLYDESRAIDDRARHHYSRTVRALLALPSPATPDDPGVRHPLLLAGEALAAWKEYANDVERRQADGGDLAGVRDWASKLAGEVARIAGCLHLADYAGHDRPWTVPISRHTTLAAWAIGEYLIPHALAAYGHMGADPRLTLARRILRWVERAGVPHFRRWECHQQMRDITSAEDLMPALALLCERHYLRQVEAEQPPARGRPKGPEYEVHPDLHQDGSHK